MLVNSDLPRAFCRSSLPGVLPYPGVVVLWDRDEVIAVADATDTRACVADFLAEELTADRFQVVHSHDPGARLAEVLVVLKSQGARVRQHTG